MGDKPIIFSGPMVRALQEGRKTQTRRILKPQPVAAVSGFERVFKEPPFFEARDAAGMPVERAFPYPKGFVSPYPRLLYAPGDRLYVREAWTARMTHGWTISDARSRMFQEEILYRADGHESDDGWWPSIHMPREFSRLTLTVTEVRVQRLQEITTEDAMAEGIDLPWVPGGSLAIMAQGLAKNAFRELWNSLHGPDAWDANPWVVALTFTVQHGNIDQIGKA